MLSPSTSTAYDLPYRCPKCGNASSNFKSLKELRLHLETAHTLTSSDPEGRRSPLTECFTKEAEELERRLKLAKEAETNNKKLSWLWNQSMQQADNEALRQKREEQQNLEKKVDALVDASLQTKLRSGQNEVPNNLSSVVEEAVQSGLKKSHPADVSPNLIPVVDELVESRLRKLQINEAVASTKEQIEELKRSAERMAAEQWGAVDSLKYQLQSKDKDLEKADRELSNLSEDKRRLERHLASILQENVENQSAVEELEAEIAEKDEMVNAKQREVSELTLILQSATEKEATARKKLESFIDSLFERAERAESQLRQLKQQGTMGRSSSLTLPPVDKPSPKRSVHSTSDLHGPNPFKDRDIYSRFEGGPSLPYAMPRPADHTKTPLHRWLDSASPSPAAPPISEPHHPKNPDDIVIDEETRLARQYLVDLLNSSPVASRTASASGDKESSLLSDPWASSEERALIRKYLDEPDEMSGLESLSEIHSLQQPGIMSSRTMALELSPLPKSRPQRKTDDHRGDSVEEDLIIPVKKTSKEHAVPNWLSPVKSVNPPIRAKTLDVDENGILWDETVRPVSQDLSVKLAHEHLLEHESHPLNELLASDRSDSDASKAVPGHVEHIFSLPVSERWRPLSPRGSIPSHRGDGSLLSEEQQMIEIAKIKADHAHKEQQRQLERQLHLLQHQQKALHSGVCSAPEEISTWSDSDGEQAALSQAQAGPMTTALQREAKRHRDALFCIFMYLDLASLFQMALVSKEWRDVSRHPALWRRLTLTNTRISSQIASMHLFQFLTTLSTWCTQLESLTLQGLRSRPRRTDETSEEYMQDTRGCLEPGLERLLKSAGEKLKSLRIVTCGNILTDRCLFLVSCHSRCVQQVAYLSDTDPVGSEVMWSLGAGCREITTLIVPPLFPNQRPARFDNRCTLMIGRCWPHLRCLCLGGPHVDKQGLSSIAQHCPLLELLELDHMQEITESVADVMCRVGLKQLCALDLTFTPVTVKALLLFTATCPKLAQISVHMGISEFFKDPHQARSQKHYAEIVRKLEKAKKKHRSLDRILHLKTDYQ